MKESDALELWCPYQPSGDNWAIQKELIKNDLVGCYNNCLGSDCMAWRWNSHQPVGEYDSTYCKKMPENRDGYCGLAGKP